MHLLTALFSIGLIATCHAALAAEPGDAGNADTANVFAGPLIAQKEFPKIIIASEDLSSPFTIAH